MNHDWHDLIQRYIAGTLADHDALALQDALKSDEDLRALYLDYMNLDVALEAHAGRGIGGDAGGHRDSLAEVQHGGGVSALGFRGGSYCGPAASGAQETRPACL